MYGVKFEHKCLWGIVCFVESYLKKPILLYEVIYERTRKEHSKKRTPVKRLLRFLNSQTNFSWVWLILGNLSDKSETVSDLSFSYFANYLFELNMNWTYFDFMLVVHHFIKSNELKLILKFIILWNFCVLYVTQCLL